MSYVANLYIIVQMIRMRVENNYLFAASNIQKLCLLLRLLTSKIDYTKYKTI